MIIFHGTFYTMTRGSGFDSNCICMCHLQRIVHSNVEYFLLKRVKMYFDFNLKMENAVSKTKLARK